MTIFSTIAQDSSKVDNSLYPKAGDVGVSILVDGLIDNIKFNSASNDYGQNILFAKYYLKNDLALRLGFGFSLNSAKRSTADSVGVTLVKRDSSTSQYLFNISGGAEKHFIGTKRLDPFVFSQIDLTFIGKTNTDINNSTESKAGTAKSERTIKEDGGIAFGLSFGGGFNYFLAQNFSLGAELALKINYSSVGGTISDNTVNTPINGNATSTFITREDQTNNTKIGVQPNALINLSYFF